MIFREYFPESAIVQLIYAVILLPHLGHCQRRPHFGADYLNVLVPIVQSEHKGQHPFVNWIGIRQK